MIIEESFAKISNGPTWLKKSVEADFEVACIPMPG
jgi:hypothetical protein